MRNAVLQPTTVARFTPHLVEVAGADHYCYADELTRRFVRAFDVGRPFQIELHPGVHCDLYRCPYCYGHGQGAISGLLRTDAYVKLLDEVAPWRPMIIVAGVSTEPTTHPDITEIVRAARHRGLPCGMYTKGYRMVSTLRDALTSGSVEDESFVTFSLDASDEQTYIDVHDIAGNRTDRFGRVAAEYFNTTVDNIRMLHRERRERGSGLRINVAYLLLRGNCSPESVGRAIELLEDCADVIRFSVPQARNDGATCDGVLEDAAGTMERLQRIFGAHPKVRLLSESTDYLRDPRFERCYAQLFQIVIDKAGNVYPCPQTATAAYPHLAYGNIQEASLAEILTSKARQRLTGAGVTAQLKCRICDRKDEAINIELNRVFSAGRQRQLSEPDE